jgi:hypothetical protein
VKILCSPPVAKVKVSYVGTNKRAILVYSYRSNGNLWVAREPQFIFIPFKLLDSISLTLTVRDDGIYACYCLWTL